MRKEIRSSGDAPQRHTANLPSSEETASSSLISKSVEVVYNFLSQNIALIIMIVVVGSFLAMLALRVHLIFAYVPEIGGIESNVIYGLQRLLGGFSLYMDPAIAPYSITQYTPLYYYLCQAIGTLFRIDPDNVYQMYVLSRSVSLVLNLLFSGTAFLILRNVFRINRVLSLIAFAYAFVYLDEESFSRPDSLYSWIVLATIGLFLKLLLEKKQNRLPYLVGASVLSILSIFAKQSAIYLPVLLLFFLLFYVKNLGWTLTAALTMAGSFGILMLMSGQGDMHAFLQNTVQGVNNGASVAWFAKRIMIEHFQKERFVNILGLFTGIYYLARGKNDALRFLGLCILGSFSFALLTSTKIGAAPNYFTEFIVLTVMAVIVFITSNDPLFQNGRLVRSQWVSSYKPLFYLLLIAFTLPPRFAGKYLRKVVEANDIREQGYNDNRAVADYLYQEERLQPTDQVLVTTHVQDYLNKFLYRNVVFPQKEIVKANPPDVYDYSTFQQEVQRGTVGYVVASLSEGHVDTTASITINYQLAGADFSSYTPIKRLGDYVVFKHRSRLSLDK